MLTIILYDVYESICCDCILMDFTFASAVCILFAINYYSCWLPLAVYDNILTIFAYMTKSLATSCIKSSYLVLGLTYFWALHLYKAENSLIVVGSRSRSKYCKSHIVMGS